MIQKKLHFYLYPIVNFAKYILHLNLTIIQFLVNVENVRKNFVLDVIFKNFPLAMIRYALEDILNHYF